MLVAYTVWRIQLRHPQMYSTRTASIAPHEARLGDLILIPILASLIVAVLVVDKGEGALVQSSYVPRQILRTSRTDML